MARALVDISDVSKTAARVYVYSSLNADEDVRVAENQERLGQSAEMYTQLGESVSWTSPEVLALGAERVESFIAANETLRSRFAFGLRDTLRGADHTLDAQGEGLLASAGSPLSGPADIRGQLVASDIPRPTVTLSDVAVPLARTDEAAIGRDCVIGLRPEALSPAEYARITASTKGEGKWS